MKKEFYIVKDGVLYRKENTLYFHCKDVKRALPVERINAIYAYGNLSLSGGVILFLGKKGIPVHFFDHYGWYKSTLYPRETLVSGEMVVKQSAHYLSYPKRLKLAQKFVEGSALNIIKTLKSRRKDSIIGEIISKIEENTKKIQEILNIKKIMGLEGSIRNQYYMAIDQIVPKEFKMMKRERRPPTNKMNALISFGNSLLYTTILSEIYNTQLNPTISYLHEPFERRFSLALDVSEIFKPILSDRVILTLVNKKILNNKDFEGKIGNLLLKETGKRKFIELWDQKLKTRIRHKELKRSVSYKRLIRLELYKLCKHFLGETEYKPLISWW